MIRIIHITDFHLNTKNLRDWKQFVKIPMLKNLKQLHAEHEIAFIAFTGDMIDKGGKDYKSPNEAFNIFKEEVINPILSELALPINRFLIIPGNHDIVRTMDKLRDELGSKEFFKSSENIAQFMVDAIKSEDYSGMERIKEYKTFEKELYKEVKKEDMLWTIFGTSFKLNIKDQSVGICCLNSAWRCYNNDDRGNLLVGEQQLVTNTAFIKDCVLKVALVHHPLDGLADVEKRIISDHLYKDFDLLLLGHSHETITSVQTGPVGTLFINLAPSGVNDIRADSRTFANGYSVVDFNKKTKEVDCAYWMYNHSKKDFVPNTDSGINGTGTAHYIIPDAPKESKKELIRTLLTNIKEDHFLEMDDHLIGMRADVIKKSLSEGFIMPPIDDGRKAKDDAPIEELLTINQIVKSQSNLMFFGNSESGKTVLLYRLIVEFVNEFEYIRKVPAYIDLSEIGSKEIKKCIKDYLRCGTADVNYLLEQNQLVLLIDNLKYEKNENNKHQINKINRFLEEYKKVQIIATSDCDIVGILPEAYVRQSQIKFRNSFIKNLRAKEIKELMGIWIPKEGGDEVKVDGRLDKLVTNFGAYGLPSTAMSVSLFLWSTEYSKKEPINSAVLLEIYIEIILDKLNKENIYRKTFDFTNKMQLLAKIAHEMWVVGESNYSIKYSQFATVVENYLKNLVGFMLEPSVIMEYFLLRKIFIKYDGDKIKFSNSCFFHFFLAKRMEYDADFKNHVMSEDEYYKFYKQIDYYTGLKRSDKEVFEKIFTRFEKAFAHTDFILNIGDIDKYFTPNRQGKPNEPVARNVEINKITENRPSKEIMEDLQNKRLEEIKDPGTIIKIDGDFTLDRLLIIMSNVLRNSEGVEDLALKKKAYNALIKYSMVYMILHKESLVDYVLKKQALPPSVPIEMNLINYLINIPLFVQSAMFKYLGTPKLNSIILEKIIQDTKTKSVSDIESFLSVGLYADIQGRQFDKQLKIFINRLKIDEDTNVVSDYCFYKLIDYYYSRTRNGSPNEAIYLDLLSELRIRTQKYPKRMKERIKKSFIDAKKNFLLKGG